MTSSCNHTSKDKHCDLFSFFFIFQPGLRYLQIQGIITCALRACQRLWHARDDPDYGTLGMPENLSCRACQRIWHARHARRFGMPGMPEILLGMNYLLVEPRLLAAWVRRSRNLKLCLQGMQNSVACQFQCKTTLGPPLLLPVSKLLTIGMGKILAC